MNDIMALIQELRQNPKGIRFSRLARICDHYFGPPRRRGTSHSPRRYTGNPVPIKCHLGEPRVNIPRGQDPRVQGRGLAKDYQVRQVIKALEMLENELENKH